jgi:hypothetical protein
MALILTGCGNASSALLTTPGSALPATFAVCKENDPLGRCKRWSPATDQCINPKGHDVDPPIVPCDSIKQKPADK